MSVSRRNRVLSSAILLAIGLTAGDALAGQADQVEVQDPRALVSPRHPGGGIFLTLVNRGDQDAVVTGAEAPLAREISLDRCAGPGLGGGRGQPQHQAVSELTVPAQGTLRLQQGSQHICMTEVTEAFRQGARFPLTLTFQDGSTLSVEVPVTGVAKPRAGGMQGQGRGQR